MGWETKLEIQGARWPQTSSKPPVWDAWCGMHVFLSSYFFICVCGFESPDFVTFSVVSVLFTCQRVFQGWYECWDPWSYCSCQSCSHPAPPPPRLKPSEKFQYKAVPSESMSTWGVGDSALVAPSQEREEGGGVSCFECRTNAPPSLGAKIKMIRIVSYSTIPVRSFQFSLSSVKMTATIMLQYSGKPSL